MLKNKWVLLARCTAGAEKRSASLHMKILGGCVVVLSNLTNSISYSSLITILKSMNLFVFVALVVPIFLQHVLIAVNNNF